MEKICNNCKHWDNGVCSVKYYNNFTESGHKCDEVAMPADETPDGKVWMFFTPIEVLPEIPEQNARD